MRAKLLFSALVGEKIRVFGTSRKRDEGNSNSRQAADDTSFFFKATLLNMPSRKKAQGKARKAAKAKKEMELVISFTTGFMQSVEEEVKKN